MNEPRWASFDCYGALVDWEAGMRGTLPDLVRLPETLQALSST